MSSIPCCSREYVRLNRRQGRPYNGQLQKHRDRHDLERLRATSQQACAIALGARSASES